MTAPTTLYRVALGRVAAFATAVAAIALFPSAAESLAQDHGAPWAVSFGSKHYDDAGYSIAVDHDGSAVVAGRFGAAAAGVSTVAGGLCPNRLRVIDMNLEGRSSEGRPLFLASRMDER